MKISQENYDKLKFLEEGLWKTEYRFDVDWMEKVLAPDFFEYGMSSRVYQRRDTLNVSAQEIKSQIPLEKFEVHLIDRNVAQVTYISNVEYEGELYRALRSSIWSFSGKEWLLKFHQGTPLKENA